MSSNFAGETLSGNVVVVVVSGALPLVVLGQIFVGAGSA